MSDASATANLTAATAASTSVPAIELGHPGWLAALIDEAVTRVQAGTVEKLPQSRRGAALDAWVRDRLWKTGVGLGRWYGEKQGPVTAATDPERALVQMLRFQLAAAASLASTASTPPSDLPTTLAALCAAASDSMNVAAMLDDAARGSSELDEKQRDHLLAIVAAAVHRHAYLDGNPPDGLPLHHVLAALESRAFIRLAAGHLRGRGSLRKRAERHAKRLSRMKTGAVELMSHMVQAGTPFDDGQRRVARRQIRGIHLSTNDRRAALEAVDAPRTAKELVMQLPPRMREAAIEQAAMISALEVPRAAEIRRRVAELVSDGSGAATTETTPPIQADHLPYLEALSGPSRSAPLSNLADTLTEAAEALATEIRETGELGVLLSRAARGESLTADERVRMRRQLVDVAKAVPALAVLAAPGGTLLLPILLRLLPFDLRPSAFQPRRKK